MAYKTQNGKLIKYKTEHQVHLRRKRVNLTRWAFNHTKEKVQAHMFDRQQKAELNTTEE